MAFVSWQTGTKAALLGGVAGGAVLVMTDVVDNISILLDFVFVSLGWLFFLVSSPILLFMGVLIIAFGVALTKSDDIFTFLMIVFQIVFGFFAGLIKLVVLILGVLISFFRVFRG